MPALISPFHTSLPALVLCTLEHQCQTHMYSLSQDNVIYPHIVDQWGLTAAENNSSTDKVENNNSSSSGKQGSTTTVSRSELERWRVNEARVVAYARLLVDPERNSNSGGDGTEDNIDEADIAAKKQSASATGNSDSNSTILTSTSGTGGLSGLESRWLRTNQDLATKQAVSDAKGAHRREAALRRAATRQQAGLYPWASPTSSSSSSKGKQPPSQRQNRGRNGDPMRGRGHGGNNSSSNRDHGSGAKNSVESREDSAATNSGGGASNAMAAREVYPVDVNDVLPRRFGPAVAQRFRTPPAGSDPDAAREMHALKLATANALLMGDVAAAAAAAAGLGHSPGAASKEADASAFEEVPASTKAKAEKKRGNSTLEAGFTETSLFPAATDDTQEADALAVAAALPMNVLLDYMEATFTVNGRRA